MFIKKAFVGSLHILRTVIAELHNDWPRGGWIGFDSRQEHHVNTDSKTYLGSCLMVTATFFPDVKRLKREAGQSSPPGVDAL
jgi:hypothetical protein